MTSLAEISFPGTVEFARPPWRVQMVTDRLESRLLSRHRVAALRDDALVLLRTDPVERTRDFARQVVALADHELITLGKLIVADRAELSDSGVLSCAACGSATDDVRTDTLRGAVPLCANCRPREGRA